MGVIYQHIKDDEMPVLLRVCYEENNHDMEQTAHDLESIDMLLAVMKAKSLINRNDAAKAHAGAADANLMTLSETLFQDPKKQRRCRLCRK